MQILFKIMSCFPCISPKNSPRKRCGFENDGLFNPSSPTITDSSDGTRKSNINSPAQLERNDVCSSDKKNVPDRTDDVSTARAYTYRELTVATMNFDSSQLIGEGGFGKVYKGNLDDGQVIAAKRLNLESRQGNQEFVVEVLMLSMLHHPKLVTLIGYCAEGDQRILVYEFMPKGSLAYHLFDTGHGGDVLDWNTRLKIAAGAARGMEYLHHVAKPAVIYRDVKSANILLDEDFNPKLSDFGLAKLGPGEDRTHVSTRVMGTYGYCAPEYAASGKLSIKSDIYSFGVVLMELVTGRRALDVTKNSTEQSLVLWARRIMKDRRRHKELKDPRLKGQIPKQSFRHFLTLAEMCLREKASARPSIDEVANALDYLAYGTPSSSSTSAPHTPMASTPSSLSPLFSPKNHFFSPKE